ncbi:MAG: MogA/MoaB family molybdenum cofactor biosynthesis protein [Treponema sp.]|jgi:molybdenum cofactor synthesis domain-containing protein|nr:MogA/MoaB family molybdenum cofactor biosynthesis protein [Treponema sp.]
MSGKENSQHTYRAAIVTSSDRSFRGEQDDLSGPVIREIAEAEGFQVVSYTLLPDEQSLLEDELRRLCDNHIADLILTTGGTGFSPRDLMPEATLAVAERLVPGINEAIRWNSLRITPRAMLSRAVSGIRAGALIVNLPGSPKAVRESLEFVIGTLRHGLDMLTGR